MSAYRFRRTTLIAVLPAALLLGSCSPGTVTPAPAPSSSEQPAAEQPAADPTPDATPDAPKPWAPAPIYEGLLTVPGTTLLGPAETIVQGDVSGWHAALEVADGTPAQSVADALVAQLTPSGVTFAPATLDAGTLTVSGQLVNEKLLTWYDFRVTEASTTSPGLATLAVASIKAEKVTP